MAPEKSAARKSRTEKHRSVTAKDTIKIARKLASRLKAGDVVCLEGDLGAGKTTFVKGVATGLGLKKEDEVRSPTFVILHIYPTRIPLFHFDLYRLSGGDLDEIGLEEYTSCEKGIACVEWAERGKHLFPRTSYHVKIRMVGRSRLITIESYL